jgi:hypothetical protein
MDDDWDASDNADSWRGPVPAGRYPKYHPLFDLARREHAEQVFSKSANGRKLEAYATLPSATLPTACPAYLETSIRPRPTVDRTGS